MNDYMAVRANRAQIFYRINTIAFANFMKGLQVVDMNYPSTDLTIYLLKIKTANNAFRAIVLYTTLSGNRISFIAIHIYLLLCALIQVFTALHIYLFRDAHFVGNI